MELEHIIPELYFSPCHKMLRSRVPEEAALQQTSRAGSDCCAPAVMASADAARSCSALKHGANIFMVFHKAFFHSSCSALSSPFPPSPHIPLFIRKIP